MISLKSHHRCAAFSLVELSVVLVIIGMLVGGIVVGKSLIRASELRQATSDVQRIIAAMQQFKTQYGGLPGDITNATKNWGSAGGTGLSTDSACYYADTSATTATCDGNGNNQIQTTSDGFGEEGASWKQLSDAGLIVGVFSGSLSCTPGGATIDAKSALPGAGYSLNTRTIADGTCNSNSYGVNYINTLGFGSFSGCTGGSTAVALFTPAEALSIDTKVDDGMPGTGNWIAILANVTGNTMGNANAGVTASSCSDMTGTYRIALDTKLLNFQVITGL